MEREGRGSWWGREGRQGGQRRAPGMGPQCGVGLQGPEWALQTHRNPEPGHHFFTRCIFSATCVLGAQW